MVRSLVLGTALVGLICGQFAFGQTADQRLKFEVASVKPAPARGDTSIRGGPGTSDPGQVTYERTWLPGLVADAYGVRLDQISYPDWMGTEYYSVVARIPPDTTKAQFKIMLQNLLAERFHLKLHHETKTLPVYILSVAPGGPKMKTASAEPDVGTTEPGIPSCEASEKNHFPTLRPGRTQAVRWCPGMVYNTYRQTMAEFALDLGNLVNMSNGDGIIRGGPPAPFVVDETGLTERYEFRLEFAGSVAPSSPTVLAAMIANGKIAPGDANQRPLDPNQTADEIANLLVRGPNVFRALETQLGLKLEKGKRPVDFLVIDQADKVPTEE